MNTPKNEQMILLKTKYYTIELKKKPKGERVRWKSYKEHTLDNYHRIENGVDFKYVNTWSFYIPRKLRVFWMWWVLIIEFTPKLLSSKEYPSRYVRFEDTHLELMGVPRGSWQDKKS